MVLHCTLRVGHCELTTEVHVIDEEASLEQWSFFDWHINIGDSVVNALICGNWDANICYLNAFSKKGQGQQIDDVKTIIHQHGRACWGGKESLDDITQSLDDCASDEELEGKARCVLYMHCYGGCKLPPLEGTRVGERGGNHAEENCCCAAGFSGGWPSAGWLSASSQPLSQCSACCHGNGAH